MVTMRQCITAAMYVCTMAHCMVVVWCVCVCVCVCVCMCLCGTLPRTMYFYPTSEQLFKHRIQHGLRYTVLYNVRTIHAALSIILYVISTVLYKARIIHTTLYIICYKYSTVESTHNTYCIVHHTVCHKYSTV